MKIQPLVNSLLMAAIATTTISTAAQAGTIRHDRLDSDYKNLANLFPSVGRLNLKISTTGRLCTGTLVASNWVLTAAHCVDKVTSGNFVVGGSTYSITGAIANQGWITSNRSLAQGYDIGLFKLASSVTNVQAATLFTGTNEDTQIGTYIGFGATGTGLTGYTSNTSGTKRAGQNTINLGTSIGYSSRTLISDFDDPGLANAYNPASQPVNLEYNIAPGDSGGAMFINNLLAGVVSFMAEIDGSGKTKGLAADADYGDFSATTRVSSFVSWIQNVTSQNSSSGSTSTSTSTNPINIQYAETSRTVEDGEDNSEIIFYEDTFQNDVKQVPEPSAILALFSVAGMLKLCRRRQKTQH